MNPHPMDPEPSNPSPPAQPPTRFRDWLAAGVRLALLLPPRGTPPSGTLGHFIGLALLIFAATCVRQFAAVGFDGRVNPWGIPGALFFVPVFLAAAWAFARLAGSPGRAPDLAVALAALGLPIVVVSSIAHSIADAAFPASSSWPWHQWLARGTVGWLVLAAITAAARLGPIRADGGRRLAAAAVAACVLALPLVGLDRMDAVWVATERDRPAAVRRSATEEAIYLQGALLERELAGIERGRPGVIDLYFVGVGAYAGQDVFMREVRSARELFERRFDAAGRAVSLINNVQTVGQTPLASATALERTLERIGAQMNRDEDVLFLFLTSHGSRDHRLEVEFRPLPLEPIDPARLRGMLDASGIKWKVIVVSACYSGGFVEALKDDTTVVITAAAPDRNSFGCSNEADFTYFGKAYLDEALRRTRSFVRAFDEAALAVGQRESEAGYVPSFPQLHAGAAAVEHLARLEARLEAPRMDVAPADTLPSEDDRYRRLARLLLPDSLFRDHRASCRELMAAGDPHGTVAREPDYFAGVRPGSDLWPKIVLGYREYVEKHCADDPELARAAYADGLRRGIPAAQADRVLQFLQTDAGRALLAGSEVANAEWVQAHTAEAKERAAAAQRDFEALMRRTGAEAERRRRAAQESAGRK